MIDLVQVLATLAAKRPIFHSEADFQHALAWEIHSCLPEASVRLELKPHGWEKRSYLDILVSEASSTLAIELKYKTRSLMLSHAGESFDLTYQGAQVDGRYPVSYTHLTLPTICSV